MTEREGKNGSETERESDFLVVRFERGLVGGWVDGWVGGWVSRETERERERERGYCLKMLKGTRECVYESVSVCPRRGGGLGSSTIFKKFNEPYAPS